MILNGGELDGKRILSAKAIELISKPNMLPGGATRSYGWDVRTRYSQPLGHRFPFYASFGHTGFTGTCSAAASFPGGTAPNVPYLTAADDAAWRGAGGTTFTLEALVNFGSISTSTTEYLAGHFGSTSERSWYVAIRRETGSPFVRFFADPDGVSTGGNVQWDFSSAPLSAGNDYYIAVVADLTQGTATARPVTLYVQDLTSGTPMQTVTQNQASNSISAFYDASVPFTIGATNAATSPYSGLVDELRFSDAALAPGELLLAPEPTALAPLAIVGLALVRRRRQR
jgi:hypothetical protein